MEKTIKKPITLLFIALLTILTISYLLTGCVPAAFVAGAATTQVVSSNKRSVKTILQDQSITEHIQLTWGNDPLLNHKTHLNVASFNGIVLLVGQTPTEEQRARAQSIAVQTPNVRHVYNQIQVKGPSSFITRSSDSWITTKVKSLILTARGVPGSHIKVITENGVVYLMGIVTPKAGQAAAEVARGVTGVQKVVKLFEYDR